MKKLSMMCAVLTVGIAMSVCAEEPAQLLGKVVVPMGSALPGQLNVSFFRVAKDTVPFGVKKALGNTGKSYGEETFAAKFDFVPSIMSNEGSTEFATIPVKVYLLLPPKAEKLSQLPNGVWIGIPSGQKAIKPSTQDSPDATDLRWIKADTAKTITGAETLRIDRPEDRLLVDIRVEGRYMVFEFSSWPLGDPWEWGG